MASNLTCSAKYGILQGRQGGVGPAPALTHQAFLPPLHPSQHPSRLAMLCKHLSAPAGVACCQLGALQECNAALQTLPCASHHCLLPCRYVMTPVRTAVQSCSVSTMRSLEGTKLDMPTARQEQCQLCCAATQKACTAQPPSWQDLLCQHHTECTRQAIALAMPAV